ncbi:MAG: hypothetical protein AB1546_02300 [bacterium]
MEYSTAGLAEYFHYLSIPLLLWFGYLSSFADIKTGRIPNRQIMLGLKIGLAWHASYMGYLMWVSRTALFPEGMAAVGEYCGDVAMNTAIALAISFLMWWMHLWAAGDAKLFTVFSFLIPVMFYEKFYVKIFPSFALLYNVFLVALMVVAGDFLYKLVLMAVRRKREGDLMKIVRESLSRGAISERVFSNWRTILRWMVGLVFSFLITSLIRKYASTLLVKSMSFQFTIDLENIAFNETILILLLFLFFKPLSKLYENMIVYYTTIFCILGYVLFSAIFLRSGQVLSEIAHFGGLSVIIIVFRRVYDYYAERVNVREIKREDLHENLILSKKERMRLQQENVKILGDDFEPFYADGLTQEQVEKIKALEKKETIEVSGTIPFAPCIFGGAMATLLTRGLLFSTLILKTPVK